MKDFTIMPLKGYGEIPFGMTLDDAVKKLGMPDFYEELSDMEETGNRSIYYEYDELETNIYFEGVTKSVVACFETENEAATLYGGVRPYERRNHRPDEEARLQGVGRGD